MKYLWLQYKKIRKGAVYVGYVELDSYERVSGYKLTPWEAELMLEIDMIRVQQNG